MTLHSETIAHSGLEPWVQLAPMLWEHKEYVLKDLPGIEEIEVNQLYIDGVLR